MPRISWLVWKHQRVSVEISTEAADIFDTSLSSCTNAFQLRQGTEFWWMSVEPCRSLSGFRPALRMFFKCFQASTEEDPSIQLYRKIFAFAVFGIVNA